YRAWSALGAACLGLYGLPLRRGRSRGVRERGMINGRESDSGRSGLGPASATIGKRYFMASTYAFAEVARLPAQGDNTAIATRRLDAGTTIEHDATRYTLSHTVLEGHRFAVEPIRPGGSLLSWGLPFGMAIHDIAPGEYVYNAKILATLSTR